MKRVYVAGKTEDFPRVREAQRLCVERGMTVTFDWTKVIANITGPSGGLKGEVDDEFRRKCAYDDLRGVREAELLVMLCYPRQCGTLIEFGVAAEREIPIVIVGTPERDSVFFELDTVVRCHSLEDLPDTLEEQFGITLVATVEDES
jgi:nucleoside 2-deoxyribosyltransferase